jgi:long-chain acyl-CoA synthetase
LGAHFVPMYEAQLKKDWEYILKDSETKLLLVSTSEIHTTALSLRDSVPSLERVLCFNMPDGDDAWDKHLEGGASKPVDAVFPETAEVAGLIYTSGTTGQPKGVVLSHGNFTSNVNATAASFPFREGDVSCSFLPWAHSFGQTAELHCMMSRGAALGLAEGVKTLLDDFVLVRPTVLFSVPRVFNKIYDGVQKQIAAGSPVKRAIAGKALAVAAKRRELRDRGEASTWLDMQYNVFDKIVFSKIRDKVGGRLRFAFSGGAALQKEVAEFCDDIGIVIFEGYGLTETSPIASVNTPDGRKLGTIGKPIAGVQIIICDEQQKPVADGIEGEIVIIGPNVMQCYHNLPEQTAEVVFDLNGERAFRSGDMGVIDDNGFVKVVGRFKEQYKLENGKYVVPTPLQEQLQLSGYILQCLLFGDNKPYNVVLIVPDMVACEAWAKELGASDTSPAALAKHPGLHDLIGRELQQHAGSFKSYERPKKWALLPDEFTVENGLLTPKMSMKRRLIMQQYQDVIDALYAE